MITNKDISVYLIPGLRYNIDSIIYKLLDTNLEYLRSNGRIDRDDKKKLFCYLQTKYNNTGPVKLSKLLGIDHSSITMRNKRVEKLRFSDVKLNNRLIKMEEIIHDFKKKN